MLDMRYSLQVAAEVLTATNHSKICIEKPPILELSKIGLISLSNKDINRLILVGEKTIFESLIEWLLGNAYTALQKSSLVSRNTNNPYMYLSDRVFGLKAITFQKIC